MGDEHVVYKLGRQPHDQNKPRLQLMSYFADSPASPDHFDFDRSMQAAFVPYTWGNTEYGDCVIAARANAAQRYEFAERGFHVNIHENDAISTYKALTGCQQPGDANDTGLVVQDALNDWRVNGWPVHYSQKPETIFAFGEVAMDANGNCDPAKLRTAVYELGTATLGLAMPLSAQAQTGNGFWDVVSDPATSQPGSWGGHCVLVRGFDSEGFVVKTWGMNIHMSDAFLVKYCEEAWGIVDSVEVSHPRFNQAQLEADLKALTNG